MTAVRIPGYERVSAEWVSQLYSPTGDAQTIRVSPDLRHCAHVCKESPLQGRLTLGFETTTHEYGGCAYVVVDDEEGPVYNEVYADTLRFAADGRQWSYVATRDDGVYVVMPAGPVGPFNEVLRPGAVFSQVGGHVALAGKRGDQWVLVRDGKEDEQSGKVNAIAVSPNGESVAWVVLLDGRARLVRDGSTVAEHRNIHLPTFSPDGKSFAFQAGNGDSEFVVWNGQRGPSFEGLLASHVTVDPTSLDTKLTGELLFSPDSKHLAYSAGLPDRQAVFLDDKQHRAFGAVPGALRFSPDSKHLAYFAGQDGHQFIVRDGEPQRPFEFLVLSGNEVYSPDSARFACVAKVGSKRCVVVDDVPQASVDGIRVCSLTFSSDSKRTACIGRIDSDRHPIVDGNVHLDYRNPSAIAFSPDGKRVAFDDWSASEPRLIVDGTDRFACDFFVLFGGGRIAWHEPDRVRVLACIMGGIYTVDVGA